MIRLRTGIVENILWARDKVQCLLVKVDNGLSKAINYQFFTGCASKGDKVLLNTTAVWMNLGTGGFHFVIAINSVYHTNIAAKGHLMKMRYTPLQIKVSSYEETIGCLSKEFINFKGMGKCPVVVAELHSMIGPLVHTIHEEIPGVRIVYIMTDSASLPLAFSDSVYNLKKDNYIMGVITCGQAFGGDFETVNVFTALMAAYLEYKPHALIIAPGPGIIGTGTKYGNTALEQGENINRINILKGLPVVIPRLSFAENRKRHFGISHHTITSLLEIALTPAEIAFPLEIYCLLKTMKYKKSMLKKHKVHLYRVNNRLEKWKKEGKDFYSMGRNLKDDPIFFGGIIAAGLRTAALIKRKGEKHV